MSTPIIHDWLARRAELSPGRVALIDAKGSASVVAERPRKWIDHVAAGPNGAVMSQTVQNPPTGVRAEDSNRVSLGLSNRLLARPAAVKLIRHAEQPPLLRRLQLRRVDERVLAGDEAVGIEIDEVDATAGEVVSCTRRALMPSNSSIRGSVCSIRFPSGFAASCSVPTLSARGMKAAE